jgi:hypothetical protein
LALYAGQSTGLVTTIEPAADIVSSMASETNAALRRFDRLATEHGCYLQ